MNGCRVGYFVPHKVNQHRREWLAVRQEAIDGNYLCLPRLKAASEEACIVWFQDQLEVAS